MPTLGICRGAQLMALAEGGTLVRDVASHFVERPQLRTVLARRRVRICEDTMLRDVLEREALLANSLHRDAVREVRRPLQVAAVEPDTGIVQAIEDPGMPFWCGVQWHPEYLPQVAVHQRLFDVLVSRARLKPQRRPPTPVPAAAVLA
jgi:putative glutamine amidotransferase